MICTRRLTALALAPAVSAALLLNTAPTALAANCPAVEAIAVPGTTQTNPKADPDKPVGVLGNILEPLRKNAPVRMVTYYTPYPATIVGGTDGGGYRASKNAGIDATNARLKAVASACPNTVFILTGYSQGADVAGDVAAAIGHNRGVIPANKLLGAATLDRLRHGAYRVVLDGDSYRSPKPLPQSVSHPVAKGAKTTHA